MSNNIKIERVQYAWEIAYTPAKGIDKKLIFLNAFMMILVSVYFLFSMNIGSSIPKTAVLGVSKTVEVETIRVKSSGNNIQSEASYSYGKIPLD